MRTLAPTSLTLFDRVRLRRYGRGVFLRTTLTAAYYVNNIGVVTHVRPRGWVTVQFPDGCRYPMHENDLERVSDGQ